MNLLSGEQKLTMEFLKNYATILPGDKEHIILRSLVENNHQALKAIHNLIGFECAYDDFSQVDYLAIDMDFFNWSFYVCEEKDKPSKLIIFDNTNKLYFDWVIHPMLDGIQMFKKGNFISCVVTDHDVCEFVPHSNLHVKVLRSDKMVDKLPEWLEINE